MNQIKVNLNLISDISLFVQAATNVPHNVYIKSDKYCINAKSIMGIYSLNLSKPVIVEIDNEDFPQSFLNKIKYMIVE